MAKTNKQTTKPSISSLTHDGLKFTLTWKINCNECESQQVWYRVNGGDWTKHTYGGSKTTATYTVGTLTSFYPSTTTKLQKVDFVVRSLRSDTTNYNYTWSDWVWKTYTFSSSITAPTLTTTINSANSTTFAWSVDTDSTNTQLIRRVVYRTKFASGSWGAWTSGSTSGSKTYNETSTNGYRYFQVKTQGVNGESTVVSGYHYIGVPPTATIKTAKYTDMSTYYNIATTFYVYTASPGRVDTITPQYYMGPPDSDGSCPSDASWTNGNTMSASTSTTYTTTFTTSDVLGTDENLWIRIMTTHDSVSAYSDPHRLKVGALSDPTLTVSDVTITDTNFSANVTVDWSSYDGTKAFVYLVKGTEPDKKYHIGTITTSGSTLAVDYDTDMSDEDEYAVMAIVSFISSAYPQYGASSNYVTYSGVTAMPPSDLSVAATSTSGKVRLEWTNNWDDATSTEISWSEEPDAWESTDEPSTYTIDDAKTDGWYVTGLDTGTTWYFRARSIYESGDVTINSPWSSAVSIDLTSEPVTPVLTLSDEVIQDDGMLTAYWGYVTTDGTSQMAAEIVEATYDDGWTYSSLDPVVTTGEAQYVDIFAETQGWETGTSRYLAVAVTSASGKTSEYSTPVMLTVADAPTCSIDSTSLASSDTLSEYFDGDGTTTEFTLKYTPSSVSEVTIDGTATTAYTSTDDVITFTTAPEGDIVVTYSAVVTTLTELPLTATITATGTLSVALTRAQSAPMLRPNGVTDTNPEGETVALLSYDADGDISISVDDLIGSLDDGALYTLIVTTTDAYGQTASDSVDFTVHWSHQAEYPTATITVDDVATITVSTSESAVSGDSVDIYRLSLDRPELIYKRAEFGETYVDPYPTLGAFGGYRLVFVTSNGDYTIDDGTTAWTDCEVSADGESMLIDYGNDQIELPYNLSVDSKWSKDFEATTYLGGSVVGDWNAPIQREVGVSTVTIRDDATISKMRELATFPDICHVRTPEGSSYAADVQVNESQSHDSQAVSFSLTITRVDPETLDGMTYEDYEDEME